MQCEPFYDVVLACRRIASIKSSTLWLLCARKLAQSSRWVMRRLIPSATISTILAALAMAPTVQPTCLGGTPGRSTVVQTWNQTSSWYCDQS